MRARFLDMEDNKNPLNGVWIDNPQDLEMILEKLRHREPFGLQLNGENGAVMDVCLAEGFGSSQFTSVDGTYLLAVKPGSPPLQLRDNISPHTLAFHADEESKLEPAEFLVGGTQTPVPTRYILPFDLVRRIAVHFLETGECQPSVLWEQI